MPTVLNLFKEILMGPYDFDTFIEDEERRDEEEAY